MLPLTSYLLSTKKQFYVGPLTGHLPKTLETKQQEYQSNHTISDVYRTLTDKDFERKEHGYAHFRVDYLDDIYATNALDTRFYYVINQEKSNLSEIKIRKDLIDIWFKKQDKSIYVLILNDLWGYEISALDFANAYYCGSKFTTVKYVDCKKNTELNDILKFNLINPESNNNYKDELKRRHYFNGIKTNTKLDDYIKTSYGFIEKTSYAKHRRNLKEDIIVLSKSTGNTKQFKSLGEAAEYFGVCYRTMIRYWTKKKTFTVKGKDFEFASTKQERRLNIMNMKEIKRNFGYCNNKASKYGMTGMELFNIYCHFINKNWKEVISDADEAYIAYGRNLDEAYLTYVKKNNVWMKIYLQDKTGIGDDIEFLEPNAMLSELSYVETESGHKAMSLNDYLFPSF